MLICWDNLGAYRNYERLCNIERELECMQHFNPCFIRHQETLKNSFHSSRIWKIGSRQYYYPNS